jgi:hypothetical protein
LFGSSICVLLAKNIYLKYKRQSLESKALY